MQPTWAVPVGVPSGQKLYLEEKEFLRSKWIFKYVKRRLFCFCFVKFFGLTREFSFIGEDHRLILWINNAAPSLGDSLMDLAARTLLSNRKVVLLTNPKNVSLYLSDPLFHAVYSSARLVLKDYRGYRFDVVICDSYSPRVLLNKIIVAPMSPFVGLYGYLNGFEIHRTYFAYARMAHLLRLKEAEYTVRPTISAAAISPPRARKVDVCIAVGGEWPFRTYDHWPKIVHWLVTNDFCVSLVGSLNGVRQSRDIAALGLSVRSTVGKCSLSEAVGEIANAQFFIGADGGLWHLACAIPVPSVVLFADCQMFDADGSRVTRETHDILCETLYDDECVSSIPCSDVIKAFQRLVERTNRTTESKHYGLERASGAE